MTTTSPESLALLGRAAELRAAGTPWAEAATQLAVEAQELRRLVSEHARDYDHLARRARTEALRETLDATLTALRGLLKSPDPGVSMRAATTIVRYDIARMRHGPKEAGADLEREARRASRGRRLTESAHEPRTENVSESPEVPNQQEVGAAKKMAQSCASQPQSASPVSPKSTPATPTAAPVAGKSEAAPDDATRRKQRLLDDFALGHATAAPTQDKRLKLEVERLVSGWLADGK